MVAYTRGLLLLFSLIFPIMIAIIPVNGLSYTRDLIPSNTIYYDDFEDYTAGATIGTNNAGEGGWGFEDHATGGASNINTTSYWSCCQSIWMRAPSITSNSWDVHRVIPLRNSTRTVGLTVYFAFSDSARTDSNTQTFSLEAWDYAKKWQCEANINHQAASFQFLSDDGTVSVNRRVFALDDTRDTYVDRYWHRFTMQMDIINKKWVSASVDNADFTYAVSGKLCQSLADTEMIISGNAFTLPVEFESDVVNNVAHTANWWGFIDDLLVTDDTSGTPGIVSLSMFNSAFVLSIFMGVIAIIAVLNRMHIIGSHKQSSGPLTFTSGLQHKQNRDFTMVILLVMVAIFILTVFAFMFRGLGA